MSIEKEYYKKIYISKINTAQDYIEQHLGEDLTIEKISCIANFSPYYFHRLFKLITQESLYSYIRRLRLEKAAFLLNSDNDISILEVALGIGFSNQASFAKAFKKAYGMSASQYRNSKNGQTENNIGKVVGDLSCYNNNDRLQSNICNPCSIDVKNVEDKNLIYIRHTGFYKGDSGLFMNLFKELCKWGKARNLVGLNSNWLVIFHDRGDITEDNKLRISVCLQVDHDVEVNGAVGKCILFGGRYAVGRFEVSDYEYQNAWDYMLFKWLPENGYKIDDRVPFEEYPHDASAISEDKRVVDIYIPISPL